MERDSVKERAIMKILENQNIIIQQMKKTKLRDGKIYCMGAGQMADITKQGAGIYGMEIEAFLVSQKFYVEGKTLAGVPILCLESMSKERKFSCEDLLIVAFRDYNNGMTNRYINEINILNEDVFSLHTVEGGALLDYNYLLEHQDEFQSVYDELADDKSRACMDAYLNQKISGKYIYLDKIYDDRQYYDDRIVDFSKIENFIDCGAYDGDSYLAFREAYRLNTGQEYKGSAYLLEPDEDNFHNMNENCSGVDGDIRFLQYGAWHEQTQLSFSWGGTSSGITESGTVSIEVDSIDHILDGRKADFIKMDIEGSELNALKGARNTIETCKPILAVCVYHRRDDLITIPNYIRSICPEYSFYIRAYSRYSQELVLYATCK